MLTIVLVLVSSVVIGVALRFFLPGRAQPEEEGAEKQSISVMDILGSTSLLTYLLIAIVLSGAGASYAAAHSAAKAEASTIDNLYEAAEYVAMPMRQAIHSATVCYSRAVAGPEWETMARGEGSRVPNNWTGLGANGLRKTFIDLTPEAQGFSMVVAADQKRGELRSERLVQAKPTVHPLLSWLMLLLLGLSLGGLAYRLPLTGGIPQIVALGIVTALFCSVLGLIHNFDRPFSGVLALQPTEMQKTEQDITEDYARTYAVEPPCDSQGQPLGSE